MAIFFIIFRDFSWLFGLFEFSESHRDGWIGRFGRFHDDDWKFDDVWWNMLTTTGWTIFGTHTIDVATRYPYESSTTRGILLAALVIFCFTLSIHTYDLFSPKSQTVNQTIDSTNSVSALKRKMAPNKTPTNCSAFHSWRTHNISNNGLHIWNFRTPKKCPSLPGTM